MDKIDNLDLKLLQELEDNARQSLSEIAKKLRSSEQVISYRINSLEKKEIIGGYYTILDLTKLGYTNYRTLIRLTNLNDKKYKEIIKYLIQHPNVLWLVDCGGRWDLLVNFTAQGIMKYETMLKEFRRRFPNQIQNYDILTTVQVIYFGRDYLNNKIRDKMRYPSFGKNNYDIINLDKTDLEILNFLSENAKMSSVEIADKIRVSPNTIILRIKALIKQGVIQGFKPLIHLENIGYSGYKALIKFQNITEEKEKEIIDYLKEDINVAGIINLVGLWDFEFEFEVKDKEQMLEITRKFRDKFSSIIKEFEVIPLFHEYKYNFFPGDLIKPENLLKNEKI